MLWNSSGEISLSITDLQVQPTRKRIRSRLKTDCEARHFKSNVTIGTIYQNTRLDRWADKDRILNDWSDHRKYFWIQLIVLLFDCAKLDSQSLILVSWSLLAFRHGPNDQHRDRPAQNSETFGWSLVCHPAWNLRTWQELNWIFHCFVSPQVIWLWSTYEHRWLLEPQPSWVGKISNTFFKAPLKGLEVDSPSKVARIRFCQVCDEEITQRFLTDDLR